MALKLTMRPGETVYLGTDKLILRSNQSVDLFLVGTLPVVREKHFLTPEDAHSNAQRLYVVLQNSYMSGRQVVDEAEYNIHAAALLHDWAGASDWLSRISSCLANENLQNALKIAREMLADYDRSHHSLGVTDALAENLQAVRRRGPTL